MQFYLQYLFVELVATGELLERLAELHKRAIWTIFSMNKQKKLALSLTAVLFFDLGSKRGRRLPSVARCVPDGWLAQFHSLDDFQPALPAGGRPAPVSAAVERRPTPRPTLALAGRGRRSTAADWSWPASPAGRAGSAQWLTTVAASSRICLAYCGDFIGRDSVRNPPADCGRYRGQITAIH